MHAAVASFRIMGINQRFALRRSVTKRVREGSQKSKRKSPLQISYLSAYDGSGGGG